MSIRFSLLCRFLTKTLSYLLLVPTLTEGATLTDLRFRFYSKTRPHLQYLEITPGRIETIPSDFLGGRVLVLYCHGFGDKPDDPRTGKLILEAYLNSTLDVNLMALDWTKFCPVNSLLTGVADFVSCIKNMPLVGSAVGNFLIWLESLNLAHVDRIHVIGASAGGQLVGRIGREYQKLRRDGKKLARISSFDPAGPLFNIPPIYFKDVVKAADAQFVDIYHTSVGTEGVIVPTGHVDFYVNEVVTQPEFCFSLNPYEAETCAHFLGARIFATSFHQIIVGCKVKLSASKNCLEPQIVGLYTPSSAHGIYYVKIKRLDYLS